MGFDYGVTATIIDSIITAKLILPGPLPPSTSLNPTACFIRSERAIRMAKVKQKISGGFRSKRGAERHAVLLSIIETAKKQGLNILETIQAALNQSLVFEGGR